jgi:hypothetical protein
LVPLQQRPRRGLAGRATGRLRHGRPRIQAGHARSRGSEGRRAVGRQAGFKSWDLRQLRGVGEGLFARREGEEGK